MTLAFTLFCISLGSVFYTYLGYPLVLMLLGSVQQLRRDWQLVSNGATRRVGAARQAPTVAVLVAAFNEERHIAQRIQNLLTQDYPAHLLHVYIGSDASTDGTAAIAHGLADARLTFVEFTQRRGKPSVINDLAALAQADILVFSDANTFFASDAVRQLVRHFDRPEVACVCGELRLQRDGQAGDNQDHIYWRYERLLKFLENRIGALLGANGGVYALRRSSYRPIPANTIVDDFWISMQVLQAGQRCVYDPEAIATETTPERIGHEFSRRVRIGMGNFQALRQFAGLLNPARGMLAFTFLSHKVLRWLAPHCLLLGLAANVYLVFGQAGTAFSGPWLYPLALGLQAAFYAAAGLAWWLARRGPTPRALRLPLFFVSMNLALLLGFWQYIRGAASGVWARTAR